MYMTMIAASEPARISVRGLPMIALVRMHANAEICTHDNDCSVRVCADRLFVQSNNKKCQHAWTCWHSKSFKSTGASPLALMFFCSINPMLLIHDLQLIVSASSIKPNLRCKQLVICSNVIEC